MTLESLLITASALIILTLGTLHLLFTFRGQRLHPRDPGLTADMQEAHPQLTRQTTMWRAWIGFNASHSLGAMLFGLIYGYLALFHAEFLFGSMYLLVLGELVLAAFLVLGFRYWFSVPRNGILVATLLYTAGLILRAL